eukprot:7277817-Alexandrium_andersonii.AAC.1
MSASLVGSEMCIRDRSNIAAFNIASLRDHGAASGFSRSAWWSVRVELFPPVTRLPPLEAL